MNETLLLIAGCVVFATTTVATLLYGYMVLNRAWLADDPANGPLASALPSMVPPVVPSTRSTLVPAVVPIPATFPDPSR